MNTELKGALESIEKATVTVLGSHKSAINDLTDRVEQIEALGDRPRSASGASRDEVEHKDRFIAWVRDPHNHGLTKELTEAESEISKKAVSIGSSAGGGYAVPSEIERRVEERLATANPFRQLVNVVTCGTSNFTALVSKNEAGSGWVGENVTRTATTTSELIQVAPTFGTLYSYPSASEESLQDVFFPVDRWLVDEIVDSFAAAEATAIWSGNGSSRPTGLKNTTPVTTADNASPERQHPALQYVPISSPSSPWTATGITMDSLIDLSYSVKAGYLDGPGVGWVMRRSTAAGIRKLVDSNSQYLWQPSLIAGEPDRLLGYPVYCTDAMDATTADLFPVAFGNFRRGYLLAVRTGMRITVDEISTPGSTAFYVRRRVGGAVCNTEAVKLLKYALT